MKLELQATSLEMSRELKEAGFKVNTCFYHIAEEVWFKTDFGSYNNKGQAMPGGYFVEPYVAEIIFAYTFQQLWKVLPVKILRNGQECYKELNCGSGVVYKPRDGAIVFLATPLDNRNIADTAAHAVLWCIKEKYIKLSKEKKDNE